MGKNEGPFKKYDKIAATRGDSPHPRKEPTKTPWLDSNETKGNEYLVEGNGKGPNKQPDGW